MFPRVVGNLHDVELQALVTLPDAVDAGDVGAGLVHGPHQLEEYKEKRDSQKGTLREKHTQENTVSSKLLEAEGSFSASLIKVSVF